MIEASNPRVQRRERGKGVLDFRVDTFLMVTKYMNYTKAAEALNITQPAVSQHIRWLEDAYGVKLFQYQGKKLRLTKAGELLKEIDEGEVDFALVVLRRFPGADGDQQHQCN